MNDRSYVRSLLVDRTVYETLEILRATSQIERIAVEVVLENVVGCYQRGRDVACEEIAIGIAIVTRAHVAEGVYDALIGEYSVCDD
jgi:hypothetical protein